MSIRAVTSVPVTVSTDVSAGVSGWSWIAEIRAARPQPAATTVTRAAATHSHTLLRRRADRAGAGASLAARVIDASPPTATVVEDAPPTLVISSGGGTGSAETSRAGVSGARVGHDQSSGS